MSENDVEKVFEGCVWHGYDSGPDPDPKGDNEFWCYNGKVKALGMFNTVQLCGRGGNPVQLDTRDYCKGCEYHSTTRS